MSAPDTAAADTTTQVIALLGPLLELGSKHNLAPGAQLNRDLAMDSLHRQSLACELDVAFGIEVPDADIAEWCTVADIAATVDRIGGAA